MPILNWIGKDKVVNHHLDVPYRVLERKYTFNNGVETTPSPAGEGWGEDNSDAGGNKIIHGDNLLALKSLLPEYEGKIKCIYIDPPYNTGNENWVYNDNVNDPKIMKWLGQVVGKESEDLTRHDKWLCMMYPRLKLLHKLLADDGAIFISIDDNEQANLKLMMDEIFGGGNFVGLITVMGNPRARDYGGIARMHDYIFVYRKTHATEINNIKDDGKEFPFKDNISGFEIRELRNRNIAFHEGNRPNLYYPFYIDTNSIDENGFYKIHLENSSDFVELYPKESQGFNTVWRWGKPKSLANLNINIVGKKMGDGGYMIVEKYRKSEKMARSIWNEKEVNTERGTLLLKSIFNDKIFNFPKPVELVEKCLEMGGNEDALFLDCFSGSGTTAHAVLNLNKQDGGNRKFICIEMEEYANTITAERVKRVINGYADKEGTGGSFDYYELGQPLFNDEDEINELVGIEKLREYIYYTETRSQLPTSPSPAGEGRGEGYFLNKHNDTAYYFFYEQDNSTTLDYEFLSTIKTKAEQYVIYADNCLLTKEFLTKHRIIFKKIPRDITKF